jgi:hypothetical protein
MKNIVVSVGLVALGASSLQAQTIAGMTPTSAKPWSIAATLRGFYDDNINTVASNDPLNKDSFGFEVSPTVGFSWAVEQTVVNFNYLYSFKYYDTKPNGNTEHYDQTHTFNALVDHAFSERFQIKVADSFVIGQEPDVLRSGNAFTTFQRVPGDNIRNYGVINLEAQMTRLLGFELGYANTLFDYDDHGAILIPPGGPVIVVSSLSGRLDRIEHMVHLDSRWTIQPQTIGVVGYQFRAVEYTGDEPIGVIPGGLLMSNDRNNYEHYFYVGADHTFRPDLTGSLRVGGRYVDYYNDPTGNNTDWGPYANLSLKWGYAPDSYIEGGFTYDLNASDLPGDNGRSFTTSQDTAVLYATIHHRFTAKIRSSLIAQYQNSLYNGGAYNNEAENYYLLGLNAAYDFNSHFSAEIGYNYDNVDSDIAGRSFDRNRVYIGVTASY